ncbi:thiamine diphosphokinase [Streptococcus ovuberis]|uniref:Thiamine diphosphokinase n=1 Tax=Streptococcus ovuberis TaxID=1936207 RepID=A0A7X6MZB7_9STRE|nr:thiamine diphosphokinase [Streptococcus ovuberis]NKZ21205.1 thiamine diphosphokinase [Streptococcus ovuberis]
MARWGLVAGGPFSELPLMFEAYAGIDSGAVAILEKGLELDLAVGDFDSVSAADIKEIRTAAQTFVGLDSDKDDTDLEMGLKAIFQRDPNAHVTVYGALGGRMDHSLSSIFLPSHPDLAPFMQQIQLVDEQNVIIFRPKGQQVITPLAGYTYVGFLLEGQGQGQLTIEGAKYDLSASRYFKRKIYGSNEFLGLPISVTVPDGYLVVVYSKD